MNQIRTLGVAKSRKCQNCNRIIKRTKVERNNLAQVMFANSRGLWALEHCDYCGWLEKVYPASINGVACTVEEAQLVFNAMREVRND